MSTAPETPRSAPASAAGAAKPLALPHPFAEALGIVTEVLADGSPRCRLRVDERHHNPAGAVHGAAAFALADTVMGAHVHLVDNPDGALYLSSDAHIRFIRPVRADDLVAHAVIEAATRRARTLTARVTRAADGALVAIATGRFQRLDPTP